MKPGLYVATVRGEEGTRLWCDGKAGLPYLALEGPAVNVWHGENEAADLRPLVVLDPESDEDCRRLADFLAWDDVTGSVATQVRAALRALADPKPAEPTGLGAVVRDRKGATYVRVAVHFDGWAAGEMWRRVGGEVNADKRRAWSDIDVAEVLSEGWSE